MSATVDPGKAANREADAGPSPHEGRCGRKLPLSTSIPGLSLRSKILLIPVVVVFALAGLYLFIAWNLELLDRRVDNATMANRIIKLALESRIAEKNFQIRANDEYIEEITGYLEEIDQLAGAIEQHLGQPGTGHERLMTIRRVADAYGADVAAYRSLTRAANAIEAQVVAEGRAMAEGARELRAVLREQGSNKSILPGRKDTGTPLAAVPDRMLKLVFDARIAEKNFLLRDDPKEVTVLRANLDELGAFTREVGASASMLASSAALERIETAIGKYSAAVTDMVKVRSTQSAQRQGLVQHARELERLAAIERAQFKAAREQTRGYLTRFSAGGFAVVAILLVAISLLLIRSILLSVQRVKAAMKHLGQGELSRRLDAPNRDEFAEISDAFNEMATNLESATASNQELRAEVDRRQRSEQEVRWRAAELERLNRKLERFQQVTLQREERIMELKRELDEMAERVPP